MNTYKKISFILATFFLFQNNSLADSIPKQFQGKWSTASDCKTSNPKEPNWVHNGDQRAVIGPRSIEWIESGCNLSKIIQSSSSSFKATFNCSGEGGDDKETYSLQLSNGRLRGLGVSQIKCR